MSDTLNDFVKLKEKLLNQNFIFENKEYLCVDCKIIRNVNLVIYTEKRTIVLFFKSEIEKIIFETADERLDRLTKSQPKYFSNFSMSSDIYVEEVQMNIVKPTTKKVGTNKVRSKIPLSDDMKNYLLSQYKNTPLSLEERPWTDEEENVIFRDSTRVMSMLLNRSIPTINKMKRLILKSDESQGISFDTSHINRKPLNQDQIKYFTEKYKDLPQPIKERPWTEEENQLLFRAKPNLIAEILNRQLYVVYKMRKDISGIKDDDEVLELELTA